jgi:hypothetical protein
VKGAAGEASGFVWAARKDGRVEIRHHGRLAATLRAAQAAAFIAGMGRLDEAAGQQRMARLTGNYRRGNEKLNRP